MNRNTLWIMLGMVLVSGCALQPPKPAMNLTAKYKNIYRCPDPGYCYAHSGMDRISIEDVKRNTEVVIDPTGKREEERFSTAKHRLPEGCVGKIDNAGNVKVSYDFGARTINTKLPDSGYKEAYGYASNCTVGNGGDLMIAYGSRKGFAGIYLCGKTNYDSCRKVYSTTWGALSTPGLIVSGLLGGGRYWTTGFSVGYSPVNKNYYVGEENTHFEAGNRGDKILGRLDKIIVFDSQGKQLGEIPYGDSSKVVADQLEVVGDNLVQYNFHVYGLPGTSLILNANTGEHKELTENTKNIVATVRSGFIFENKDGTFYYRPAGVHGIP